MSLGDKIFDLRKKYGFSQEQLGEKINVTRQTISNWELGETAPNPEQLKRLSKVLKISIDDLLNNDIATKESSNKEKLTKLALKNAKILSIIFITILIIDIISFIIFTLLS